MVSRIESPEPTVMKGTAEKLDDNWPSDVTGTIGEVMTNIWEDDSPGVKVEDASSLVEDVGETTTLAQLSLHLSNSSRQKTEHVSNSLIEK